MYAPDLLTGAALPDGTLCLTYDDGPGETPGDGRGPRTLPLAQYLADEGIRATFFMTGRHVAQMPHAAAAVRALGHLVGNHTYTHQRLPEQLAAGGDIVDEIAATDALIGVPERGRAYVRPPYGDWSPAVAGQLCSVAAVSADHVGPVGWDISGEDWQMWQERARPHDVAQVYLAAVEEGRRGIVLMHDSTADSELIKQGNAAYEATRLLVPELVRRGYTFVGLDDVPLG